MPRTRSGKPRKHGLVGGITRRRMRRVLVAVLTTLLVFALLVARLVPEAVKYQKGDTARGAVRATRAVTYIDQEATDRLRDEAGSNVPNVYTREADAQTRALGVVRDIFTLTRTIRETPTLTSTDTRAEALRGRLDVQLPDRSVRLLVESSPGSLQRSERLTTILVQQAMSAEIRSDTDDLVNANTALAKRAGEVGLSARYRQLAIDIGHAALQPNMILNLEETEKNRQAARAAVPDVRRQLQPGDIVIFRGDAVTDRHLAMFTALGLIQPSLDYVQALSLLGVLAVLMLSLMLFIRRFAHDLWNDDLLLTVLCCTLIVVAGLFAVFRGAAWFEVFGVSTVSAAAIFLALTVRRIAGSAAAIFLGVLVSLTSPLNDAHVPVVAILAALLASQFVRARESRSSTITRSAVLAAFSNVVLMVVVSHVFGLLVSWRDLGFLATGGVLASIVAAGVITVIERPLGLTTPLRLLELQNPNEPILKRLLTEAPGSYQSCVMVANIAEPAAAAVGADPILTRTACMYHDIGKLKRSYFFVENQFGAENPHERLSPHLSALVIMSHVKDGLELAEEMKVPLIVASVIPQHHGTGLVSFMYQRAQAEAAAGEEVRESDFRYPGPKPQTKENAIIMLADTVEAAARTLEEPTRPKIAALVNRLVDARIADGQLDESPLTFADITVIKQSFVSTVAGMFHQRLAYPTEPPRPAESAPPVETPERVEVGH
jgi:hypothetical protein